MNRSAWQYKAVLLVASAVALAAPGPRRSPAEISAPPSGAWRDDYRRPTAIPYPDANPYSDAKADLGRVLFFDPRTSYSQTRSCASCHPPNRSWADGLPIAQGEGASSMKLRVPTLLDIAWLARLGWDGKFRNIEAVTFGPILAPSNGKMTEDLLLSRLKAEPSYRALFAAAFPDKAIDRRNIELAVATFERSIRSGVAPFDAWIAGQENAISPAAKRGFALFNGRANCSQCHSGWSFTDGSYHDIGVGKGDEIGRGRYFPSSRKLQYAFKTPTLRDVAERGPYMHDGSIPTLEGVIDLYDRGGIDRPSRSELIKPLRLTDGEKSDLIAFLMTLNDDDRSVASSTAGPIPKP